jgi:branched-chain amino acid transport system permease protein
MKVPIKTSILAIFVTAFLVIIPTVIRSGYVLTLFFGVYLCITLSQSWNILGGYTGQVNVGFAVIFGTGVLVTRHLWLAGMPFIPAFLLGGIGTTILGVLVGSFTFFLKGPYFSIVTLAIAMIARLTIGNILPRATSLPTDLLKNYSISSSYNLSLLTAFMTLAVTYLAVHSKIGLAMKAIREDEEEASAIGINSFKTKRVALMISSFFGGLAGTMIGPIVGSVFFVLFEELFILTAGEAGVLMFGVAFILVVLFLPKGLVGLFIKS